MEPCDDCEIETLAEHGIFGTQDVRGLYMKNVQVLIDTILARDKIFN